MPSQIGSLPTLKSCNRAWSFRYFSCCARQRPTLLLCFMVMAALLSTRREAVGASVCGCYVIYYVPPYLSYIPYLVPLPNHHLQWYSTPPATILATKHGRRSLPAIIRLGLKFVKNVKHEGARAGSTHAQTVIHQLRPRQVALTHYGTVDRSLIISKRNAYQMGSSVYGVSSPSPMVAAEERCEKSKKSAKG